MNSGVVMTKREVMELLEFEYEYQLADLFGITRGAVSQWPDDQPIPPARMLKLRYELRPDLFQTERPETEAS